jgi:hypothetical protein
MPADVGMVFSFKQIEAHERRLRADNEQRRGRSLEEMAAEASTLRELLHGYT